MGIREFHEGDLVPLFSYWIKLGSQIPYFFPVTLEKWRDCLLDDTLEGEKKFTSQVIYLAIENDKIAGFIQWVQPAFAWDENGEKYPNSQIGNIRHFYFDESLGHVAGHLFDKIEPFQNQFQRGHAFYHIFGMSCNAHHGKLHESLSHVERFLLRNGYEIEHENLYYSLNLARLGGTEQRSILRVKVPDEDSSIQGYDIVDGDTEIGGVQICYLDALTDGATKDVVYLNWIMINNEYRRQGWASKAIRALVDEIRNRGYKYLHTDTAHDNLGAQRLYESLGFKCKGRTKDYITNNQCCE
jgi:ribosomal protein S18 acetylase RimI-like enzyme